MLNQKQIEFKENDYKNYIVSNYKIIDQFASFDFMVKDFFLGNNGEGIIDLYGEKDGRPVIIELKKYAFNPSPQLKKYSKYFNSPMLIGITENPFKGRGRIEEATYMIFDDLTIKGERIDFKKILEDMNNEEKTVDKTSIAIENAILNYWLKNKSIPNIYVWFSLKLGYKNSKFLYRVFQQRRDAKLGYKDVLAILRITQDENLLRVIQEDLELSIQNKKTELPNQLRLI